MALKSLPKTPHKNWFSTQLPPIGAQLARPRDEKSDRMSIPASPDYPPECDWDVHSRKVVFGRKAGICRLSQGSKEEEMTEK